MNDLDDDDTSTETNYRISDLAQSIDSLLRELLQINPGAKTRPDKLERIVRDTIDLSRCLTIQNAHYVVQFPFVGFNEVLCFDPECMYAQNAGQLDESGQHIVVLAIVPALIKYGDERGENVNGIS